MTTSLPAQLSAKMLKILPYFHIYFFLQIAHCSGETLYSNLRYVENPINTHKLSVVEDQLVNEIQTLPRSLTCSDTVTHYLERYHAANVATKHLSSEERATRVVENALSYYKLISRVVGFFKGIQTKTECHQSVRNLVEKLFSEASLELPGPMDLRQAILGILRIHYVYGFNATTEIRLGIFGKVHTGVILDLEECLEIAQRAIFIGLHVLAYQWLVAADKVLEMNNRRDKIAYYPQDLSRAWNTLTYQLGLNCSDLLHPMAAGMLQTKYYGYYWDYKYYATCRGQTGQTSHPLEHDLCCYYKRTGNWYLVLNPVRVEEMSRDPPLLLFHEFIGEETVEFLKNSGDPAGEFDVYKSRFNTLSDKEEESVAEYGQFLNSVPYYLYDEYYNDPLHPTVKRLDYKIDMATGIEADIYAAGMLLYSSLGSHYDIHHDTFQNSPAHTPDIGDRLGNFLIFLSDTELGGHLGFPMVGVYAKPRKGNAVFWLNSHRDGQLDFRTFHVGCPIILGKKQIIRTCIFEYDNVFKYKCGLKPPQFTYGPEIAEAIAKYSY